MTALGFAPDAVLAHHFDQHAFAQSAIRDAQPPTREGAANGIENGAAGEHEIGTLGADTWIGHALFETHGHELFDNAGDLVVGEPAAIDAAALVARQAQKNASDRRHRAGSAEHVESAEI